MSVQRDEQYIRQVANASVSERAKTLTSSGMPHYACVGQNGLATGLACCYVGEPCAAHKPFPHNADHDWIARKRADKSACQFSEHDRIEIVGSLREAGNLVERAFDYSGDSVLRTTRARIADLKTAKAQLQRAITWIEENIEDASAESKAS